MITEFAKKNAHKVGIDRATYWTLINKIMVIIKGPATLYFIITYLSPTEQGIWYTFGSLAALTILAELGFTNIITQFISHEFAHLKIKNGTLLGNRLTLDRLIGLARFSIRFYMIIIPIAILILSIIGYFYFRDETLNLMIAWFIFAFVNGFNLLLVLMQSIYQGLDKVKEIQVNMFIVTICQTLLNWTLLVLGYGIWAIVLGNFIGIILAFIMLYKIAIPFWKQIYQHSFENKFNFMKEVIPLQGKYAVSMISAYFTLYLIVPLAYKTIGKIEAGQLGISISLMTAVFAISVSWITTKIPMLNILVSKRKFGELNSLFKQSLKQGLLVLTLLSIILLISFQLLIIFYPSYGNRFLPFNLLALMIVPQFIHIILSFYTYYLRAFKQEPLMWVWVLQSAFTVFGIIFIMSKWGIQNYLIYQNITYLTILLPLTFLIYKKHQKTIFGFSH